MGVSRGRSPPGPADVHGVVPLLYDVDLLLEHLPGRHHHLIALVQMLLRPIGDLALVLTLGRGCLL
jgi:hypothetical protein